MNQQKSTSQILKQIFGYDSFRLNQSEVINHITNGGSGLVIMPTGGGKSLCYQIPAISMDGTCIVVSPLIALMQDQVITLQQQGVSAGTLNSQNSDTSTYYKFLNNQLDILYMSPEKIVNSSIKNDISRVKINLIAIDEAHCISQWGHDFRPEYTQLKQFINALDNVPVLALTATADDETQKDIKNQLGIKDSPTFSSSFDRQNIKYIIDIKNNGKKQILQFIKTNHTKECGIVYCTSRKKTEEVTTFLNTNGIKAIFYHAGMKQNERSQALNKFKYEDNIVVVATIAFGMGIDKGNVRFVAHLDAPKNIESYYQETGRAGRDGLPATAYMTYSISDIILHRKRIEENSELNKKQKIIETQKLDYLTNFCETHLCRRDILLKYFDEKPNQCDNCDNCLFPKQTYDATVDLLKIVSCIYRTGQRFGKKHIIDVLIGNETEKITSWKHNQQSTYGIGADKAPSAWEYLLNQAIAIRLIKPSSDKMGGIELTNAGANFVKQKYKIELPKINKKPTVATKKQQQKSTNILPDEKQELFSKLKKLRMELAQEQSVPAFVIFSDATLINMCIVMPQTKEQLLNVSGIGQHKQQKYGDYFLDTILIHS